MGLGPGPKVIIRSTFHPGIQVEITQQNAVTIYRIINIYRSFNPQNGLTPRAKFVSQLNLIKSAMTKDTIVIGDFNLDYKKFHDTTYQHKF